MVKREITDTLDIQKILRPSDEYILYAQGFLHSAVLCGVITHKQYNKLYSIYAV